MTMLWNLRHSGEGSASTHKEVSGLWTLQPNARMPRAGRTAGQTSGQPPGRAPMESRRTRRTVRGTAGKVGGRVSGNCGGTQACLCRCTAPKQRGCTIRICWPARRPDGTYALARKALNACRAVSRGVSRWLYGRGGGRESPHRRTSGALELGCNARSLCCARKPFPMPPSASAVAASSWAMTSGASGGRVAWSWPESGSGKDGGVGGVVGSAFSEGGGLVVSSASAARRFTSSASHASH